MATAAAVDVFPTPPLPPKKTKRSDTPFLGCSSSSSPPETPFCSPAGAATLFSERTPPLPLLLLLLPPLMPWAAGGPRGAAAGRVDAGERCCCLDELVARRKAVAEGENLRLAVDVTSVEREGEITKPVVLLAVRYARERRAAGKDCDLRRADGCGMLLWIFSPDSQCSFSSPSLPPIGTVFPRYGPLRFSPVNAVEAAGNTSRGVPANQKMRRHPYQSCGAARAHAKQR